MRTSLAVKRRRVLTTVAYTLQLYFDFSGYSSIPIGLGLMVPEVSGELRHSLFRHLTGGFLAAAEHQPAELASL
jgi:hypothetical protein